MLNKDQYNQDAYNDYYAQATEGAEIKGGSSEGGGKKIIIILLLLLLIGALAYFVWKSLESSQINNGDEDSTENSVVIPSVEKPKVDIKTEPKKENIAKEETIKEVSPPTREEKTTEKIVKSITSAQEGVKTQMSPEDMAKIVQMVTQQIREESQRQAQQNKTETTQKDSLEASLEEAEVDTLSIETLPISEITKDDSKKQASSDEKPNTYNKVLVNETSKNTNDDLSRLSEEISNVINTEERSITDTTGYTQSLKSEVETRVKEMRYVTVKKGDTLGKIAKRIYGNVMDYKKIYEANPDILRRPDRIYIGQRLRVPE